MDNVFIDSEGKIKRSSMHDEHSIVSIVEKNPNASNIGNIVSGDTNSNIITFEMARYYDGEDIYNKNIRFIIKNNLGVYTEEAVNLQYNDTKIRFVAIENRLTALEGNTSVDNLAQKVADSIPYEDEEIDFSTEFETGGNSWCQNQ